MYLVNPYQGFALLCIQKVIPLFLLSSLMSEQAFIFVAASSLIGGMSGMAQNSVIKLMAYSSIVHSRWILSGLLAYPSSGYFYFLVYTSVSARILIFLQKFKVIFVSEVIRISKRLLVKVLFIKMILTLSGIPPFIGFFTKAYVIKALITYRFYFVVLLLVLGSSLSFFFYTRLIVSLSIFNFVRLKEKSGRHQTPHLVFLVSLSAITLATV
jgi:NADH:ubiquinone oxidoreductase subunit 2 (subunit N)